MSNSITGLIFRAKTYDIPTDNNFTDIAADVGKNVYEVKLFPNSMYAFQEYRKIIGCDYIEISGRIINNRKYCIVCDEEGRFVDNPIFTMICAGECGDYLDICGTVIIFGPPNLRGDLTSLTDSDIENIMSCLEYTSQTIGGKEKLVPVLAYEE